MKSMLQERLSLGMAVALFVLYSETFSLALGQEGGIGSFGGELRGPTRVTGRILCVTCTVKEVQDASAEHVPSLYVFTNGTQQAVFQVTAVGKTLSGEDASQLAYWRAVTGLSKKVVLRMKKEWWESLVAEENLEREVELTGLLRSTGTFDVAVITPVDF